MSRPKDQEIQAPAWQDRRDPMETATKYFMRNFEEDRDIMNSEDMLKIYNLAYDMRKLEEWIVEKRDFDRYFKTGSDLLKACTTWVKENEKKMKKMPEEELAFAVKKLNKLAGAMGYMKSIGHGEMREELENADLDDKTKRNIWKRYRSLGTDARRVYLKLRKTKWTNRKKHGKIKSVKKSDKVKQTSLSDLMKDSKDKDISAQPKKEQSAFKTASVSQQTREQAKGKNGVQLGAHREKDNSFKAEIDKSKERKTNLKLGAHREKDNSFKAEIDKSKERKTNLKIGAHRENVDMLDNRVKKEALKLDQGMKDNRSKKDVLKGGPKK